MATLDDRNYSAVFTGLKSTGITAGIFFVAGCTLHELFKRLRRYPDEDRARKRGEHGVPDRGMEGWAMGYLYRARTYVGGEQAPDYGNYPLSWIWEAIKRKESYFESHDVGPDAVVYLKFLRGTFYWTLFLLCTVFPVLIAINFIYSPDAISTNSIDRASVTSLVKSQRGIRLLGIHVACVWIVSCSWFATLFWIGRGALRVRQNELRHLLRSSSEPDASASASAAIEGPTDPLSNRVPSREIDPAIAPEDLGWRYRTVLVRNIPPALRSELAIRDYFEHRFRHLGGGGEEGSSRGSTDGSPTPEHKDAFPLQDVKRSSSTTPGTQSGTTGRDEKGDRARSPLLSEIVLVRRQAELISLYDKYLEVLHELETAHVLFCRNVMAWVERTDAELELAKEGQLPPMSPFEWVRLHVSGKKKRAYEVEHRKREGDDHLFESLRPFLGNWDRPSPLPRPVDADGTPLSIWTVLSRLHSDDPALLDRFHSLKKLRRFHRQAVPAIDYWLTKLNILTSLIDDLRARPDKFPAASTAFVTFERVDDAIRARTEFKWRHPRTNVLRHGGKVLEFRVKPAPETRDLHWEQLVVVSLQSDLLRGTILQALIWAGTIVWVVPISFLIGLFSLESLTNHLPNVAAFLQNNSTLNTLFSSLLPTALMAVLNMFVPTILGILQRKGKTIITESKWSSKTQSAYHKFLIINFIVVFCIGISAFTAFLNAFRQPVSVLNVVASSFPKGATFFVSWSLLIVGLQNGLEIALFGISWINHSSIRKYVAPRKREKDAVPRFFGFQNWVPTHLLIISVSLLFACLNPLVIAFNFAYFAVSFTVFKNQFAHVYYRRNFEGGGRVIYRRIFRASLDMAIFSQFVLVAFFWVLKKFSLGGACIPLIPITVLIKLIGSRYFDHRMDELDVAHAKAVCGEAEAEMELSVPLQPAQDSSHIRHRSVADAFTSVKTFATVTAPALLLRPAAKLPAVRDRLRDPTTSHWRPASESVASKRSRSNVPQNLVRARASTSPDDQRRPILLETIASRESEPGDGRPSSSLQHHDQPFASPAQSFAPFVHQGVAERPSAEKPDNLHVSTSLVTPHPPVIRDDRPVSHLHYRNPAETTPLARSLWLPRDPLKPVDLGDTIDYHGRAFVSSQGGEGIIGSWDDLLEADEDETGEDERLGPAADRQSRAAEGGLDGARPPVTLDTLANDPHVALARKVSRASHSSNADYGLTLRGNERVMVAADVAAKVVLEGGKTAAAPSSLSGSDRGSMRSASILGRRRSTQASIVSGTIPSPQHSPVLRRSPHEAKPPSPGIPSFHDEPETIDPGHLSPHSAQSAHAEPSAYPFPPPVSPGSPVSPTSPTLATASPTSPTRKPRRLTVSSLSPPSSRIGIGYPPSASAASTVRQRSTRSARSASIAPSLQHSVVLSAINEPGEEGPVEVITQAAALRAELLHEELKAHEYQAKKEEERVAQESRDRQGKSGFLRKLLVRTEGPDNVGSTVARTPSGVGKSFGDAVLAL
ncbi:hypothetical protein JCM10212_001470 [Sporobolomyces blumeae]